MRKVSNTSQFYFCISYSLFGTYDPLCSKYTLSFKYNLSIKFPRRICYPFSCVGSSMSIVNKGGFLLLYPLLQSVVPVIVNVNT